MMVMVMTVLMLVSVTVCMLVFVGILLCMGVKFRASMETAAGQIFRFLYFTADVYNCVGTHNSTGILFLHGDSNPFMQVIHDIQKGSLIRQEFIQCTHQHIAGGTHFTF